MDMFRRLRLPSPSMAVAVMALMVALGGTGYAAVSLPKASVGAKQLKPNAVERTKIKNNAVNASKVQDGTLTGADIVESTLAKVPSAALADKATHASSADNATHANSAAALDKVTYKTVTGAVAANSSNGATATCDPGQRVIGGGGRVDDPANGFVIDTYPDGGNAAWSARFVNANDPGGAAIGFTVYAICTTATSTG